MVFVALGGLRWVAGRRWEGVLEFGARRVEGNRSTKPKATAILNAKPRHRRCGGGGAVIVAALCVVVIIVVDWW
jgi:hypothetical protein